MLTEQQRRYAEGRAAGLGKREAAIAAGCPPKTATQAAARHEKRPEVRALVFELVTGKPAPITSDPSGALVASVPGRGKPSPLSDDAPDDPLPQTDDPRVWLRAAMNCPRVPVTERVRAATKLADLEAKEKPLEKPRANKFRPKVVNA